MMKRPHSGIMVRWLLALAGCVVAWAVHAASVKDGVGLGKISLPSGPGSIEGLGSAFEPQLNSGTAAYSVTVALPPGVGGLQPEVVLAYNGGLGNGPFGIGWGWEPMSLQRQTEKGIPGYTDGDILLFLGEELVALEDGSYRVENQGGFHHIRRDGDGWLVRDRRGTRYRLGTTAASRIVRPGQTGFQDTFKWYVDEVIDTHGNRMVFEYARYADSPGQLYCQLIRYSIHRTDPSVHHAVEFRYGLRVDVFSSLLSGFEIRTGRRCEEVRVLSRGALVRRYRLDYDLPTGDAIEAVSVADAGLGFSLLRRVTQFDRNDPGQDVASGNRLPPLQFGYTRLDVASGVLGRLEGLPPYSLGNPNLAFADIDADSLPDLLYTDPFTGRHSYFRNLGKGRFAGATGFGDWPWVPTLDVPGTQLADFDGDGRVDLVQKAGLEGDRFVYFPNPTQVVGADDARPIWGAERSFEAPYPPFDLGDPSVRTLDLDGDKRMDYLRTTGSGLVCFLNRTNRWEQQGLFLWGDPAIGSLTAGDGIEFSETGLDGEERPNPMVKLADMNGDRMLDLVRLTLWDGRLEIAWWPNFGNGRWGRAETVAGFLSLDTIPAEDVFVEDLNGDGLADVLAVDHEELRFWINQGVGRFSAQFQRTGMPAYQRGQTVLRQVDVNGNGSTDLVWENEDPQGGGFQVEFYDFIGTGRPNLLRTVDNGIGLRTHIEYRTTTDYAVEAREAGRAWTTRLPFPTTVVSRIERELGLDLDALPGRDRYITELSYWDGFYDAFERQFRGFAFARKVELGDDRESAGTEVASPTTVTRLRFHTGAPDGIDNNGDGEIDEVSEEGGREEESLKGRPLWSEVTRWTADAGGKWPAVEPGEPAPDAVVFHRELSEWRVQTLHSPSAGFQYVDVDGALRPAWSQPWKSVNGRRVNFAFLAAQEKVVPEARATLEAGPLPVPPGETRRLRTTHRYDAYGNEVAREEHGVVDNAEFDDERFTRTTFAINPEAWIVGLPATTRVTDETGAFVSEERRYYDGSEFVGLELGQVGSRGLVHRVEKAVNGEAAVPAFTEISPRVGDPREPSRRWIPMERLRYDAFGNLVETRDPLYAGAGQGHVRSYTYDAAFQTYVEEERVSVGGETPDLVATAAYDTGAGVMTGFVDFNGNATRFQYDSFWRLVGIVKPGDTEALPTAEFTYSPADPFRGLRYRYDKAGRMTLENLPGSVLVNTVGTIQRERAGSGEGFETRAFSDGAGHKLGTVHEGAGPEEWVAKDFKRFSSRGAERKAYVPFQASSPEYLVPMEEAHHVAQFQDELGRVVRSENPPETDATGAPRSSSRTLFLPLQTLLFDEEDSADGSVRFNTPHIQWKDGLDRLIGVTEVTRLNDDGTSADGLREWRTRYAYDLHDNLTHIVDSQGNQKWFRYDGLKRKLFMNDPDRGVLEYAYDDASNLRSTVDAKGQRITYSYDGVNRLLTEDYLDAAGRSPDVRYQYDRATPSVPVGEGSVATARNVRGMLASVQDLSGEEHSSYDVRGRVEWVIKRLRDPVFLSATNRPLALRLVSYRTGYEYDSLDRVTRLTYPDEDQVGYEYNGRNLLRRIAGGPSGSIISNILYRASDQMARIDYGNGVRTTYDYDPRLRLRKLRTVGRDAADPSVPRDLIHFDYEFDRVSNITAIRDQRPGEVVARGDKRRNTQLFQYDDLYRITRASYSFALPGEPDAADGFVSYRYDRIGNMLEQRSDIVHVERGVSVTDLGAMAYGGGAGPRNRKGRTTAEPGPHALTSVAVGSRAFPYDANGNMTLIDGMTNTWDFKDRLVRVENAEMRADYTYDYSDRRVMKSVFWKRDSTNNVSKANPGHVLYPDKYFEVREADAPVKYVWNGNTRVARVTGNLATTARVQRFRLFPGQNLIGLAISTTNTVAQFAAGSSVPGAVRSARRWIPESLGWADVLPGTVLPAGSVLWVEAATNATLTVQGVLGAPPPAAFGSGVQFFGGWGLAPLDLEAGIPSSVPFWHWDPAVQAWAQRLTNAPPPGLLPPRVLPTGGALAARSERSGEVVVPKEAISLILYSEDHLGSASILTDLTGLAIEELSCYAYGETRNALKMRNGISRHRFSRREYDDDTGLCEFDARYLNCSIGRFVSVDFLTGNMPLGRLPAPQYHNSYAYCENDPVNAKDIDGNSSFKIWKSEAVNVSLDANWKAGEVSMEVGIGGKNKDIKAAAIYDQVNFSVSVGTQNVAKLCNIVGGAQLETPKFQLKMIEHEYCVDLGTGKSTQKVSVLSLERRVKVGNEFKEERKIRLGNVTITAKPDVKVSISPAQVNSDGTVSQSVKVDGGGQIGFEVQGVGWYAKGGMKGKGSVELKFEYPGKAPKGNSKEKSPLATGLP